MIVGSEVLLRGDQTLSRPQADIGKSARGNRAKVAISYADSFGEWLPLPRTRWRRLGRHLLAGPGRQLGHGARANRPRPEPR